MTEDVFPCVVRQMGRVVIPAQIRQALGLRHGSTVQIHRDGGKLVLTTMAARCVFGSCEDPTKDLVELRGRPVCSDCRAALTELAAGNGHA